ncbi:hypothetical protein T4D_10503 [Trichinella pseudospiralis]|uniref:Uncharacterized protein n=1 Tax=Trichinella pseudospiralis TaxID=6337 RepID=A0A0V1G0H3_TRIPS|nr:hypothetical protein T4D_10503 [Trichinella pseudospiralis]
MQSIKKKILVIAEIATGKFTEQLFKIIGITCYKLYIYVCMLVVNDTKIPQAICFDFKCNIFDLMKV